MFVVLLALLVLCVSSGFLGFQVFASENVLMLTPAVFVTKGECGEGCGEQHVMVSFAWLFWTAEVYR